MRKKGKKRARSPPISKEQGRKPYSLVEGRFSSLLLNSTPPEKKASLLPEGATERKEVLFIISGCGPRQGKGKKTEKRGIRFS